MYLMFHHNTEKNQMLERCKILFPDLSDFKMRIIETNKKDINKWVFFLILFCLFFAFSSIFKKSTEKEVVKDVKAESALE